ncbi:hypothetical protein QYE76_058405 [Lolium multiflorum]|uniref:Uncharacterized protein n=1 Tax=Lolium multiflorum TaxID=4521 RepID=A0AAD8T5E4_LOLMU|nr:hypothetical protein QYE76_058405 [Lolium multiflorum]
MRHDADGEQAQKAKQPLTGAKGKEEDNSTDADGAAHPKLSTPPETGGAHTPPLRRHAILPSYLMASSAAEPPPPPPPPPGGGEGSASTRSRSTPFAEFVCPSGVPTVRISRGEDWESEGSNAWIPSGIDPALAFRLVVRLDSSFTRDSKRYKNGFYFPAVVATTISLRNLKANIYAQYSWRSTAAPSVPSASGSQIVRTVDVEDDADIEDQSPQDDEDELMFPELVDRCSKQAMEDQYMEDIAFGARFDDTDDEEKNENDDSLVLADYEGEDLPTIEWNREDPQLAEGTVFQTMMDCRNAITTYHILTKNNYEVIKSEPVDPAFGMEDQAGAANAEENEAAIQLEIEAAVQHEEIEAANAEEIEAAIEHEEIEPMDREQREQMDVELLEPMDREQREHMDVEWLQPMSLEEREQYSRECLKSSKALIDANFKEYMAEEKAQASQKKKNKKEGKRKVDTGNIPGRVTRSKMVAPSHQEQEKDFILNN